MTGRPEWASEYLGWSPSLNDDLDVVLMPLLGEDRWRVARADAGGVREFW